MPYFSPRSASNLITCAQAIQDILNEAIEIYDFSVTCGHRGKEAQNKAFEDGNSKARWGQSSHNSEPSDAFDVDPYPILYPDIETDSKGHYAWRLGRYYRLAGVIMAIAHRKNIKLIWGGEWEKLKDYGHFELK